MDSEESFEPGETQESDTLFHQTEQVSFDEMLESVEEFSIRSVLGRGGFGTVYLAFDTTLQREVALKVPHRSLVEKKKAADNYLREARAIASLDHRAIIPVYRASSTPEIPCYIVTKRIRGCHLGQWRKQARPRFRKIAEVLATVADALAYAHKKGIVHRDIKPGNILIDQEERPYVADFGLALRDADPRGGSSYVGTPSYMSPEQARGEGHRVDGRSDLFSFGSVLYEMLTGQRPFQASDRLELYEQILYAEADHPCQLNADIPPELARICLKLLSKSVSDRYSSAELVAAELRAECVTDSISHSAATVLSEQDSESRNEATIHSSSTDTLPAIIPKGLRSFSLHDAEFYPQLLPGPYDRDGVPESIRFWISKLDPTRAETVVTVGLIYGPSGCGKTSLVRAGIIPRLPRSVDAIYVQATAHNTERDLVNQIESRTGSSQSDQSESDIHEAFASLRRRQRSRTVVFIDQFEQWLFAHPDCVRESLTSALRQCDGVYLQCVLMVRDDFWMGVTRMMQALDIPIVEHQNVMAADLFDGRHARNVLAKFGAAYGKLPDSIELLSPAQRRFLNAAVNYLESNGRVICVQLALLTEMLKNRSWDTTSGLFGDGGAGLGMRFFEETFDSDSTPRRIRVHAEGSLRILRVLLPEVGSHIKGSVRTEDELLAVSGYGDRSQFRQLIAILDRELHLITPTDRSDDESLSGDSSSTDRMSTGYQLTHDFLVAPIQQWVEYHSRTTKQGKAKLRLEEFSELYRVHPRPQSLPNLSEFLAIRRYARPTTYNDPQRKMMGAAMKRHCRSTLLSVAALAILSTSVVLIRGRIRQHNVAMADQAFAQRLLVAEMADAVEMAKSARENQSLRQEFAQVFEDTSGSLGERVRASLVLSDQRPDASKLLISYLLDAPADEVAVVTSECDLVNDHSREQLWSVWNSSANSPQARIRAAAILASDDQLVAQLSNEESASRLVKWLLAENPIWMADWASALRPIADQLVPSLASVLRDESRSVESLNAVNLMVDWAGDDIPTIVSLLPTAKSAELNVLCDALSTQPAAGLSAVQRAWQEMASSNTPSVDPAKPWGSPWWCVGERQPIAIPPSDPIDESLTEALRDYEWVGGSHAIIAHQVPLDQLEDTNQRMETAGYRLANLSTYEAEQARFCYGLWLRDGAKSKFAIDCSVSELRQMNQQYRNDGYFPDVVSAYRTGDGSTRFHAFWIAPPDGSALIDADMYADVAAEHHQDEGWQRLGDRGLWLNRCGLLVRDLDGQDRFTSIRWQTESDIGYEDNWNQDPDQHASTFPHSRSLKLVSGQMSLHPQQSADRGVVSVWWKDLPVESDFIDYRSRREHLRAAGQRIADGWYPVSIDATSLGDDSTPQFRSNWWRELRSYDTDTREGNQLRNLAVACFLLDDPQPLTAALQAVDRPALRGAVIEGFKRFRIEPAWLLEQVQDSSQPETLRRGCAMAMALIDSQDVPEVVRSQVNEWITALHAKGDPGLRSALEAVANSWEISIEQDHSEFVRDEIRSVVGDRLVTIRPINPVWLGSPANEPGRDGQKEPLTPVIIDRTYAIAANEVTINQYLAFQPDHSYAKDYAPTGDCPIIDVTWFDAARYCRWLSEKEGIPESQMCYPPIDEIKPGMQLEPGFLNRIGYRLPTEAEWEYACRGGSPLSRWFGFDPERLDEHAWTARNSEYVLHPIATKLPNDYGLFDMLGNAMDFCHTKKNDYPRRLTGPIQDPGKDCLSIDDRDPMINRGGAVLYQPLDARAAQRDYHGAGTRRVYLTFRIARTVPQD